MESAAVEISEDGKLPSKDEVKQSQTGEHVMNGLSNGINNKSDSHHKHKHKDKDKDRDKDRHHDKHKHKDKDKDRDRERQSSKEKSSKDKDSSSEKKHKDDRKDKEHRDKDKERQKDKERDKDKEHRSRDKESRDKVKDKDSEKNKENRDKGKEHSDKDRHKDRDHSKSKDEKSSSKTESGSSSSKSHSSSSSSKDKDRHHSSSRDKHSSDKHRDKHSSSGDKHSSSNDKHSSSSDKHSSSSKHSSSDKKSSDKSERSTSDKAERSVSDKTERSTSDKAERSSSDKPERSSSDKTERSSSDKAERSNSDKVERSSSDKAERSSSDKSKHKEKSSESDKEKKDSVKVKTEPLDESQTLNEKNADKCNSFEVKLERMKDEPIKAEPITSEADDSQQSLADASDTEDTQDPESPVKDEPMSDSQSNDVTVKTEEESEDDIPLSKRSSLPKKRKSMDVEESDEDDVPLSARKKVKKEPTAKKRKKVSYSEDEEDYSEEEDRKKKKKNKNKVKKEVKQEPKETASPTKRKKKEEEEEQHVWKWWEEEKKDDGVKWNFLEHKGPMFAPPYERLPKEVKFYYNGKEMRLSQDAEEIATFYSRLIEHEYTTKEQFNKNFFKDWRKAMTPEEKEIITDLSKCNFRSMYEYFIKKSEERKAMSKEEKKKIKEENEAIAKEYGVCIIDGHKEKIGNFKIEPPGLFRGRGEHPKMGMLKKRVMPEDVIINCSKDSKKPEPPPGHKWKEVRHDNTVTWLASWTENVQGNVKYVMLNPSSKLKGEKDWQKYETARKLAKCVDKIREDYREDWKSKEMRIRQRAVAMYFIDKLALRAGNEKDEDQADTVGCCSLRVEHIQLHEEKDGKEYVVVFDFLGKDSIRYYNEVPVEKRVFKNLVLFCERKKGSDDLFDRLNTSVLNKHLNELMEGLTAKVFRTYNASITLQKQLNELTDPDATVPEKLLQYNRANRAVAILCNHQRSVPKSHEKSMGNLKEKIAAKREQVAEAQKQLKEAKRDAKNGSANSKMVLEKKKKAVERLKDQLLKLEVQETDKEENKTIALGTSKLNYLDPRISVAWCKKYGVPIDKVYNKTQRSKFNWAIDMAGPDFVF